MTIYLSSSLDMVMVVVDVEDAYTNNREGYPSIDIRYDTMTNESMSTLHSNNPMKNSIYNS